MDTSVATITDKSSFLILLHVPSSDYSPLTGHSNFNTSDKDTTDIRLWSKLCPKDGKIL